MDEKQIFQGYELQGWSLTRSFLLIILLAVAIVASAGFGVTKVDLLTTKGCDTPLIGPVCTVVDAVYLAGEAALLEADLVDKDYEKTDLADAEITWVDTASLQPLKYPEGYFALANPEAALSAANAAGITDLAGIPVTPSPADINPATAPATLPTPNPNPISNLPNTPGDDTASNKPAVSPVRSRTRKGRVETAPTPAPVPTPTPADVAKANDEDIVKDPLTGVDINRKPLRDYATLVKTRVDNKEVDLFQPFKVTAEAVLKKDGRIDVSVDRKTKQPKSRIILREGDKAMGEIAEEAIEAVGDSGWLAYLHAQGVTKIQYSIEQNAEQISIVITSDQPSPERASTVTSGIKGLIDLALTADRNKIRVLGDDERTLLQSAMPMSSGKMFILNFTIAKPIAMEMIMRRLQNMQPAQPSSTAAKSNDPKTRAE